MVGPYVAFTAYLAQVWASLLLCSSIPLGTPPAPPDPSLARIAPQQTVFYVGWAGMAVPDAKSSNRAERFLADPEIRQLRCEAARRFHLLLKSSIKSADLGIKDFKAIADAVSEDVGFLCDLVVSQPSAGFISRFSSASASVTIHGGFVMNIGGHQKRIATMLESLRSVAHGEIEKVASGGFSEFRIKQDAQWHLRWDLRDKYLIVSWGEETPDGIAKRMGGKEPAWFAMIGEDLPIDRRAAVLRVDFSAIVAAQASGDADSRESAKNILEADVRTLTLVTGLDREDFVSQVLVELDKPSAAALHQRLNRPLKTEDMAVIPRDATLALATRIDSEQLMAGLRWLEKNSAEADKKASTAAGNSKGVEPEQPAGKVSDVLLTTAITGQPPSLDEIGKCCKTPKVELDDGLCKELVASLGDAWRVYTSPGEGCSILNSMTAVVRVKDRDRLRRLSDRLAARKPPAKTSAKAGKNNGTPPGDWAVRKTRFAGRDVYYLVATGGEAIGVPTWCLVDNELVWSLSPPNVKAYLLRQSGRSSLAEEPTVVEAMRAKQSPTVLFYEDSLEMFRGTYAAMQGVGTIIAAHAGLPSDGIDPMLLPAAPTIAKYLRPAVSTIHATPKGVRVTIHQSLPNGNLGATLYVVACALLPANADALITSEETAAKPEQGELKKSEELGAARQNAPLQTFTEKEGPCSIKKGDSSDKDVCTVEIGENLKSVCKFYRGELMGQIGIHVDMTVKNTSKERRYCQYYVAFFDKAGKLVCCTDRGLDGDGLDPGTEMLIGSCLKGLPDGAVEKVTSYKMRLYETGKR